MSPTVPADLQARANELGALSALICIGLTLVFAYVRSVLKAPWSGWLAAGFALHSLSFAGIAIAGHFMGPIEIVRSATFAGLAYLALTIGMWRYAMGHTRPDAHLYMIFGFVLLAWSGFALGLLSPAVRVLMSSLVWVSWGFIFVRAQRQEPDAGHRANAAACLSFPLVGLLGHLGWLTPGLTLMPGVVSIATLGVALMTTSMLRARAQAFEAERATRRLNETLEAKVIERTSALTQTVQALEGFNRSVSHDLRGPLGGMSGVAQIAAQKLAKGDHAEATRLLGMLARQADQSRQMVDALLELARSASAPVSITQVDVQALCHQLVTDLSHERGSASLPVTVEPMHPTLADRALLRQVLRNLVGNALKFTGQRDAPRVVVRQADIDGETVFEVEDNGVGFEPAVAEQLFQPFVQAHDKAYGGDGIGLSIVQRIVLAHGGWIKAIGRPGQGALFRFSLGRHELAAASPAALSTAPGHPPR